MIRLSPPHTHGHVQVERPVLDGHKRFLATAQEIGHRILGEDIVGSISDTRVDFYGGYEDELEPLHIETPVGTPRFETSAKNDLALVLFHAGVRRELHSRLGLSTAYATLNREMDRPRYRPVIKADGTTERARSAGPGLMRELRTLSQVHNIDHEYMPITCDYVSSLVVPGDNYVIGLLVSPACRAERALVDQSSKAYEKLEDARSQLVRTTSPFQVTIPFARFPLAVKDHEYMRIFESLQAELREQPVRMHVGEPRVAIY